MWLREKKKKLKNMIRFHSANKIDNYGARGGGEKRKKNAKESKEQVKKKRKNNKCFP